MYLPGNAKWLASLGNPCLGFKYSIADRTIIYDFISATCAVIWYVLNFRCLAVFRVWNYFKISLRHSIPYLLLQVHFFYQERLESMLFRLQS